MAQTQGTVACLSLSDGAGFVGIKTSPTSQSAFILWIGVNRSNGPIALWIPELSIAMARGLQVTISHPATSAFIDAVRIDAP
jgi:hypothetical protein